LTQNVIPPYTPPIEKETLITSPFGNKGAMMEIETRKEENATVVSVTGKMDAVSAPVLEKELSQLMADGEKGFILDLGQLDYISSAGLRVILATAKRLKEKEGKILLASLQDMVKEVFEISGFSAIIPIYESVESALNHV
jgi:anti-anti-sigma factor